MSESARVIAEIQAAHRRTIVAAWGVRPGMRILEIGCGQGDLTVALAEAVGDSGHVSAVDAGPRSYGAPLTLGQATDLVAAGPLGSRIEFHFDHNIRLTPLGQFDAVAMAHASWYFASAVELGETFAALRAAAPLLLFAEWDLMPHSMDQMPHFLAVQIQEQLEALGAQTESNIRTPLPAKALISLLADSGWAPGEKQLLDSRAMQDADWEIAAALAHPAPTKDLATQQIDLRTLAKPHGNPSLNTYSLIAERK